MDWRPIETAPRDGTSVDLLDEENGEIVQGAYWGELEDADDDEDPWGAGWLRNGEYALEEGSRPSHWRPASKPS
jgi:hypothetical protein